MEYLRNAPIFMLAVTLLNDRANINRQTNDKTSQRFGKIKRAASQRSKPTQCSTFAFAPTH